MDTILLCGGHMDDAFVLGCIENIGPDCIIGIDRGLEFCYRNRIVPQYILGDFDSISPEVINWYRSRNGNPHPGIQTGEGCHRYPYGNGTGNGAWQ